MPYASVNVGATQVLVGPQFTPALILDLIEQENVTKTAGVRQFGLVQSRRWKNSTRDLSSLKAIYRGGSASPKGLIKNFERNMASIILSYMV